METKLTLAATVDVWEEKQSSRSTQLVFCDLSTRDARRFNVYDELRARLMEHGIPEKEIAFIHDAESDAEKKILFDPVNGGRVRILIGSTEKMGAGTNVQQQKEVMMTKLLKTPETP